MKLLGSDFDGTFSHGGIDERKLEAVRRWRRAGNKFGIISGRGVDFYETLRQKYTELEFDFLAACNGGYIVDFHGNLIFESRCRDVSAQKLTEELLARGGICAHIINDRHLCVATSEEALPTNLPAENTYLFSNFPSLDFFYQVSVPTENPERASEVVPFIRDAYGEKLTPLQNGRTVDIVPKGVNKAQGLYRLMEHYGCNYDDVIAVGDQINDMDMIREFHSYAMENGVEQIKAAANGIVSSVTQLLETLL